jgi:hypothetical protein
MTTRRALRPFGFILLAAAVVPGARAQSSKSELEQLRDEVERQRARIERLEQMLERQAAVLERLEPRPAQEGRGGPREPEVAQAAPAQAEPKTQAAQVAELDKKVTALGRNLGGFRFSGDFRYRFDVQARSGNAVAAPLQNIRNRYRLRFNADNEIDRRFTFHMQLSTGPYNNALTNDTDFAGTVAKAPFSVSEAWVDFHPNSSVALRMGRMEEVFADNMRFIWDDDFRFNGFQERWRHKLASSSRAIDTIELRAAQYILSNPNVAILQPGSPFTAAGFQVGRSVRAANLFHPGFVLSGTPREGWRHSFTSDLQVYRNPDQIQLASTAAGFPVLINNTLGLALSGPMTGAGNATTTPGGAVYSAPNFQIARLAYRIETKKNLFWHRPAPVWFDVQVSRNTGTSRLRDAVMASLNVGAIEAARDVRFLYQFVIKDANAMISQFTDDDLGTGTGVNIAVHAFRFDLGLTRFLQWQNLLFVQSERRPSNPADLFFVPLQRGANTTFRYQMHLAFRY